MQIMLLSILLSTTIFQIEAQESSCGGFEKCIHYWDGCNTCSCGETSVGKTYEMCTEMACSQYGTPECTECTANYTIINGKCDINTTSIIPSCGGIDYCHSYSPDGCNTCGCTVNGYDFCTMMYCGPNTGNKCISCVDGYEAMDSICIPTACNLPQYVGMCRARIPRYYYNNETEICELFYYGGCHANDNNFETEEECMELAEQCKPIESISITTEIPTCGDVEGCSLYSNGCAECVCDSDGVLSCDDMDCIDRITDVECSVCDDGYYLLDGLCVESVECGGFVHCESYNDGCNTCSCDGYLSTCTRMYCMQYQEAECRECEDGYTLVDGECEEDTVRNGFCELNSETGPCKAAFNRWYYDAESAECFVFMYGGCNGNDNNFATEEECVEQCVLLYKNNAMGMWVGLSVVISMFVSYCL